MVQLQEQKVQLQEGRLTLEPFPHRHHHHQQDQKTNYFPLPVIHIRVPGTLPSKMALTS